MIAPRSRRVERRVVYATSPGGSFSGLHQKTPRAAPSPGLPGISVLQRTSICISSSDFPGDGFIRRALHGSVRLHFQSNTQREEILNYVAEAIELRIFWGFSFFLLFYAHLREQTRVFEVNRKGSIRLVSADCIVGFFVTPLLLFLYRRSS